MRPQPILLLTRPEAAARRFLAGLPGDLRRELRPVMSPLLNIVPLCARIDTAGAAALIFTSSNGVDQAARLGVSRDLPVYTVGAATARAATQAGWNAVMAGKTADALVKHLPKMRPPMPLLHLHGRHVRGQIAGRLSAAGLPTEARAIYDQVAQPLAGPAREALNGQIPVIVPLFSPRTAALFGGNSEIAAPLIIIAFSPAVAERLHITDTTRVHICAEPTEIAMHAALCDVVRALCRVEGSGTGE